MTRTIIVVAALAAFLLPATTFAAEHGDAEKAVPVGPPQPRVLEGFKAQGLPPRGTDPSWLAYQEGRKLFAEKRLGESLLAFRKAIDARKSLFGRASSDIEAALASKEAAKARGSLSSLMRLLAARDLIPQELQSIRERSEGSPITEMALIRERVTSNPLHDLIDATLLVVENRGLARIGDSLSALQKAAEELASYPEAEFWVGKVYLAEGEARLAELQVARACDMGSSLENVGDLAEMLGVLAGILRSEGNLKDCEAALRKIADASDLFAGKDEYYRDSMERILATQGIDKFMDLYRVEEKLALNAYSELGSFYLDAGRPIATIYFAAAVNASLTTAMGDIKLDEPRYSFSGISDLLKRILADGDRSRYAEEVGLWKDLVLLGQALAATGDRESAREIWTAVSSVPAPEPWKKRAQAALARPQASGVNASKRSSQ
jgi:tetratricopeptide (TPR) repeat protein